MTTWNWTHVGGQPARPQYLSVTGKASQKCWCISCTDHCGNRTRKVEKRPQRTVKVCVVQSVHITFPFCGAWRYETKPCYAGMGGERITPDSKSIGRTKSTFLRWALADLRICVCYAEEVGEPRSWTIMLCPARCRIRYGLSIMQAKRPTKRV